MTNYYSAPDEDDELREILLKIPEFQERFLRLLQRNVIQGEDGFAQEMADMTIRLITEAYNAGKLKGKSDALKGGKNNG